jgi:hypothetical protein
MKKAEDGTRRKYQAPLRLLAADEAQSRQKYWRHKIQGFLVQAQLSLSSPPVIAASAGARASAKYTAEA